MTWQAGVASAADEATERGRAAFHAGVARTMNPYNPKPQVGYQRIYWDNWDCAWKEEEWQRAQKLVEDFKARESAWS